MNKRIAKLFVDALNSDEYPQITNALHTSEGFCAQGVLCDVYIQDTQLTSWKLREDLPYYSIDNHSATLPSAVARWAQLINTSVSLPLHLEKKYGVSRAVMQTLNDNYKATFKEIAECVTYTYLK